MTRPVPLIRRFTPILPQYQERDAELDEVWSILERGDRLEWPSLLDEFRVVILADAGAGKTFELKAEAERLLAAGRAAFFIRIEDIDALFGTAFEVGTPELFERWLDGTEEAWFFLDSVDEVRLEAPRAFETAIRAFADRILGARQRAHIYISSRPYAWRAKFDRALIEETLPYEAPRAEPVDEDEGPFQATGEGGPVSPLRLYRLAPLDLDDMRIFAGHRGVGDADALLAALERAQLLGLAQLPFDLEDLVAMWQEAGSLDSRLAVLERGLARRLGPPAGEKCSLSLERALAGAKQLALVATLTGEASIRLPGARGGGLDAAAVLHDWTDSDIRELLSRGVFSDAIYSMVRFRHRETRELLAAQCLAEGLQRADTRKGIEAMLFREVYGETVVVPKTRPLLPWLILFDEGIRDRALSLEPGVVTEGGDPARLPLEVRQAILREIVAKIATYEMRGGDNEAIARIAHDDLADEVVSLIEAHETNDEVIFFLGRLAWQGNIGAAAERLAPIALDPARGIYARIAAARAVATLGGADACRNLWEALNVSGESLPRRLLAELLDNAPPDRLSIDLLLRSLDTVEPHARFETSGLTQAIHRLVDRLPMTNDRAPERPLVRMIEGLAAFLEREPHIERRECKVSESFAWLIGCATHTIERLVVSRSQACFGAAALGVLGQIPAIRSWGSGREDAEYKTKLGQLVPRWNALNDALFWHTVDAARAALSREGKALTDDWDVSWMGHLWNFDTASFVRTVEWISHRPQADDRLVALSRSFRTYVAGGRSRSWRRRLWRAVNGDSALEEKLAQLMRPPASLTRRRWRERDRKWEQRRRRREENEAQWRTGFVARLKANPALVRAPSGIKPGEMTWDQAHLLQAIEGDGLRLSRHAGAQWKTLIPEFGEEVAKAFRDGAMRHWRVYRPVLRSEGGENSSIPYPLIFAMAGLEIEAGDDGAGLARLRRDEALYALRFVPFELNGFPSWFEPLYRAFPNAGFDLIWGETLWELTNAVAAEPSHYMLHDVVYHAPWLQAELAEPLCDWLFENGTANDDCLRYGRAIMLSGGVVPARLAALARRWANDPRTPAGQLPSWFALWVEAAPDEAIPSLEAKLTALSSPADARFAEQFVVALVGGRSHGVATRGLWKTPEHLKSLYLLMHRHIRVADDINRANGGTYSPTVRDDAQDARSHLFSLLSEIPGEASYRQICALADDHPEPKYRTYMRQQARRRAVEDSDRAWTLDDVQMLMQPPRRDAA